MRRWPSSRFPHRGSGAGIIHLITAGAALNASGFDAGGVISGSIFAQNGIHGTGRDGILAGLDITGTITCAAGDISQIQAGRNFTADLAGEACLQYLETGQDIAGAAIHAASINEVRAGRDFSATLDATSDIQYLSVQGAILGNIIAETGSITDIAAGREVNSVTGRSYPYPYAVGYFRDILTTEGSIGSATHHVNIGAAGTIGGITVYAATHFNAAMTNTTITSGGDITAITIGNSVDYNGTMADTTINSGGDIHYLTVYGACAATVSAHGSINAINSGIGNLAGSFTALTGSLPDITCDGSITAALTAGTTIGNLTASQNIAGTVFATGSIGEIVTRIGNISGNITSTNGGIAGVAAGSDLSANITAAAGSIGDLIAGHNLAGNMSAHASIGDVIVNGTISGSLQTALGPIGAIIAVGDITNFIAAGSGAIDIASLGSVTGSVSGADNIILLAQGTVSGDIITRFGAINVDAGGNIATNKIFASGDILIKSANDICVPKVVSAFGSVAEDTVDTLFTNATAATGVTLTALTINESTVCVAGSGA